MGSKLRRIRREQEMSQRALGALVGHTHSWVYDAEHGYTSLDDAMLCRLAGALGVSVEDIRERDTMTTPPHMFSSPTVHNLPSLPAREIGKACALQFISCMYRTMVESGITDNEALKEELSADELLVMRHALRGEWSKVEMRLAELRHVVTEEKREAVFETINGICCGE